MDKIFLEDVQIDIRSLQDGKLYGSQYQKPNRLDENLRMATLMRDNFTCQECKKRDCRLEAHHIVPRRLKGADTISNLIALCQGCHAKTIGVEEKFISKYQGIIGGKSLRFDHAQHVMQGKTYLRHELSNIAPLELTIGSTTANRRIAWGIEKSHSNDAIVITGLRPNTCAIKEWIIRPMRRQSKAKTDNILGVKHRDLVKYSKRNGDSYVGYITALFPDRKECNITTTEGKLLKKYGIKSTKLLWRFNKIYWL